MSCLKGQARRSLLRVMVRVRVSLYAEVQRPAIGMHSVSLEIFVKQRRAAVRALF